MAEKFIPVLHTYGHRKERHLYRAIPAMTPLGLGLQGVIRMTAPFCCFLRHARSPEDLFLYTEPQWNPVYIYMYGWIRDYSFKKLLPYVSSIAHFRIQAVSSISLPRAIIEHFHTVFTKWGNNQRKKNQVNENQPLEFFHKTYRINASFHTKSIIVFNFKLALFSYILISLFWLTWNKSLK